MFVFGRFVGALLGVSGGAMGALVGISLGTFIDRVLRDAFVIEDIRALLTKGRVKSDRSVVFGLASIPCLAMSRTVSSPSLTTVQRCLHWAMSHVPSLNVTRHAEGIARDMWSEGGVRVELSLLCRAVAEALQDRGLAPEGLRRIANSMIDFVQALGGGGDAIGELSPLLEAWGIDRAELSFRLRSLILLNEHDCGVLGIDRTASPRDIKRAYRRLASQFHPDTMSMLDGEQRRLAHEASLRLRESYERVVIEAEERERLILDGPAAFDSRAQ